MRLLRMVVEPVVVEPVVGNFTLRDTEDELCTVVLAIDT